MRDRDAQDPRPAPLASGDRISALRRVAQFVALDDEVLADLADHVAEERYEPDARVFVEGDVRDRLLIIAEGTAELSAAGSVGRVPLATLGAGETVGELAAIGAADGLRNATLTALTPLVLLSLGTASFLRLLDSDRALNSAFQARAQELMTARFIKHVGPFMTLDDADRRWLARRLRPRSFAYGETILQQGEPGDSCFLLRSGRVEVVVARAEERVVAQLGPGSVVGEGALLTGAPRGATVRATEDCELLELRHEDVDAILARSRAFGRELVQLFRGRERPVQDPAVLVAEHETPEDDAITILKHPEHLTYYRLTERGRFIWDRLDGRHDLRALTLEFFARYQQLAPVVIADIVAGLGRARMITSGALKADVERRMDGPGRIRAALLAARRLLEKDMSVRSVDQHVTRAYDAGARVLFRRPAQSVLAVVAVAGLVAFASAASDSQRALAGDGGHLLLAIVPGYVLSILLHEAGHAFTVKAFGRQVNRAGVGWYWFAPVVFVDTSDMWLGTRRERILVSLAGPYVNLVLGGVLSLAALASSNADVTAILWSAAVPNYLLVLFNLNPLLEFDGYHALTDVLDRPNLRIDALAWIGPRFPHLGGRREVRQHLTELLYAIASVLYVGAMAMAMILVYRLAIQGLIETFLPAGPAHALAWIFAAAVSLLAILGVAAELGAARRGSA